MDMAAINAAVGALSTAVLGAVAAWQGAHVRYHPPTCVDAPRRPTERDRALAAARTEVEDIERAAMGAWHED